MKAIGTVVLSFLSGLLGGALSHRLTPAPVSMTAPKSIPARSIHLEGDDSSMDLNSDGLYIRLTDGREIRLNPRSGLEIQSPRHHIVIATIDAGTGGPAPAPQPDGAYVLLDTNLLHSVETTKGEKDLYWSLFATGQITREQMEAWTTRETHRR
jgi:hypothetical protein